MIFSINNTDKIIIIFWECYYNTRIAARMIAEQQYGKVPSAL